MKITNIQRDIFSRDEKFNQGMYLVFGESERQSVMSLEAKGVATLVTLAPHNTDYLKFQQGYSFDLETSTIQQRLYNNGL